MVREYRHIALFFVGFYFFPIIFQPIHIFNHHNPGKETHGCAHHHHHLVSENESILLIEEDKGHCYICEYEFPVNNGVEMFHVDFAEHSYIEFHAVKKASFFEDHIISCHNPRAPPIV